MENKNEVQGEGREGDLFFFFRPEKKMEKLMVRKERVCEKNQEWERKGVELPLAGCVYSSHSNSISGYLLSHNVNDIYITFP